MRKYFVIYKIIHAYGSQCISILDSLFPPSDFDKKLNKYIVHEKSMISVYFIIQNKDVCRILIDFTSFENRSRNGYLLLLWKVTMYDLVLLINFEIKNVFQTLVEIHILIDLM